MDGVSYLWCEVDEERPEDADTESSRDGGFHARMFSLLSENEAEFDEADPARAAGFHPPEDVPVDECSEEEADVTVCCPIGIRFGFEF